jgi:hypothetical protein
MKGSNFMSIKLLNDRPDVDNIPIKHYEVTVSLSFTVCAPSPRQAEWEATELLKRCGFRDFEIEEVYESDI